MNIIRIILLIALMILLIRKKMTIGVVLLLSALITGLMFMGDYVDLPIVFINSIFSSDIEIDNNNIFCVSDGFTDEGISS